VIIKSVETIRVAEFPDVVWVQLHTDTGLVGLGETWYAASTVQAAVHDHFGPLLVGRDPMQVEGHWQKMFRLSDHAGYGGAELRAISALDMALWDLKGQSLKLPVYEMLGGLTRNKVNVYNTCGVYGEVKDSWELWRDPVAVAKSLLDEGITGLKFSPTDYIARESDGQWLFHEDMDWALVPVRRIRDALGMEIEIASDGHGKWNLAQAVRVVTAFEPYRLMWHEELISPFNEEAHLRLQRETRTPLAAAERLLSRHQFRRYIESGAARVVMPDLSWTGGITEGVKVAHMASAHQLPVAPHDCVGPVNMFAAAHLCMSQTNVMIMEYNRAMHRGWYGKFVDPNIVVQDGYLHAPDLPGIGTRLRPEVRNRRDATVQVSSEPREWWLDSRKRYVYPPADVQEEFDLTRAKVNGGRKARGPMV
jgi:L-alanine-DL-glutamate epimerase-like enolase superfamily enzyme